jgi:hypothetical protein
MKWPPLVSAGALVVLLGVAFMRRGAGRHRAASQRRACVPAAIGPLIAAATMSRQSARAGGAMAFGPPAAAERLAAEQSVECS